MELIQAINRVLINKPLWITSNNNLRISHRFSVIWPNRWIPITRDKGCINSNIRTRIKINITSSINKYIITNKGTTRASNLWIIRGNTNTSSQRLNSRRRKILIHIRILGTSITTLGTIKVLTLCIQRPYQ